MVQSKNLNCAEYYNEGLCMVVLHFKQFSKVFNAAMHYLQFITLSYSYVRSMDDYSFL